MGTEVSSVASQQFWRRRLANLRRRRPNASSPVLAATDANQRSHVGVDDIPKIRLEDVPHRHELELSDRPKAPQASPPLAGDNRDRKAPRPRRARRPNTSESQHTLPILSTNARDVLLAEDVRTLSGLFQLLKYDMLHLALESRQNLYDRKLNAHLYPNHQFSKILLFASMLLFLFGASLGGVVIFLAAFLWRERLDG
ncbi:hypothetical protein AB7008_48190 [Bradyrhizobium sp. 521_C7_N1_3]|uniref:hypothetical protein n=1 Tax=Bradyrhizobium sp. 521_C7_N1_3 TaxID=3240368 RepID=UPI003F8C340D